VARADAGALFALWAIAAALVGGAARCEGPSVAGTLLGSLAVAVLVNGLPLADVSIPAATLTVAALLLASLRGSAAPGRAEERRGQPAGAVPKQSLS
jgi:ABC-type xylose transport system permease subunit